MRYLLKLLSPILFIVNLILFLLFSFFRLNSKLSYSIFRKTFAATGGMSNDFLSYFISKKKNKLKVNDLSDNQLISDRDKDSFESSMREKGYFIFEKGIPDSILDNLLQEINSLKPQKLDFVQGKYVKDDDFPNNISSPRYQYRIDELLSKKTVNKIITDMGIVSLAKKYLKSDPICDLIACWWSFSFNGGKLAKNKAAQMYHFDMDRIKFIKFFIYLTDVDLSNGPHCYVENSHKNLPFFFHRDGRFTDEEVATSYSKERMKKIVGKKGTLIAVDTRGLHKGLELETGKERLIFQVQYTNSLYGHPYPKYSMKKRSDFSNSHIQLLKGVAEIV